jgi:pimeloyl-ACP methyl ester carboxylesterase
MRISGAGIESAAAGAMPPARAWRRAARIALAGMLCGVGLVGGPGPAAAQGAGTGPAGPAWRAALRAKLAPCRVPDLGVEALCGSYPVWENRAAGSGRRIDLKVVVVPALNSDPARDPIFFFAGGPGEAATENIGLIGELGELRFDRDMVFIDQRGTGGSHALDCRLPGGPQDLQGYLRDLFPREPMRECERTLAAGADLTLYSTPIAMDDIDEVRAWLGYERINLFGGSYGTVAAQVYMRQHPEHVRSAVLIGCSILDPRTPLFHARQAQAALDKVFDDCADDAACRAAYPDLRGDLKALLARLDRGPVEAAVRGEPGGRPVTLSLARGPAMAALRSMLYGSRLAARIPFVVHRAAAGDFTPLAQRALDYGRDPVGGDGLYMSVVCTEGTARIDPALVERETAGTFLGDDRIRQQVEVCSFWPRSRLPAGYWEPLTIAAPVLVVSGWLDPVTPPEWGAEVARHLPNGLHVVIRDAAHGGFGLTHPECLRRLLADFYTSGAAAGLDTSCTRLMKRPPFVLPGNAGN